jgi:hypothetical protein
MIGARYRTIPFFDLFFHDTRFNNNLPGMDFVRSFFGRHKELSVRRGNLIKRSRAALSHADVNEFFDNYEKTAAGIPPENIFNCDETNLQAGFYILLLVYGKKCGYMGGGDGGRYWYHTLW